MKSIIKNFIILFILLFSFALIFTVNWLYNTFGNLTLEEIVFNLKVPLKGTNADFYFDYIKNALPYIVITTAVTYILLNIIFKKRKNKARRMKESNDLVIYKKFKLDIRYILKIAICIVIFIASITYVTHKTDLMQYVQYQLSNSNLIEDGYVNPKEVEINFPEEKRNLIYIFLESMETTYYSKANGGAFDESIAPEMEQLALENTAFSNLDNLKGSYVLPGGTWTMGAMVAQSTGIPLKVSIEGNSYGNYSSFLPGAYTIGQVLQEQGYNQMLMVGSDATFGGRSNFYSQHGEYDIFEVSTAISEGKMQQEDMVWWGFSDSDLFKYAKEKITLLSQKDEPFNFTMLTADTHHPNGYVCPKCQNKYDDQYLNVIACSSRQVSEFVKWIQEQDFYENTTIVICGDHLSMKKSIFPEIESKGYERTTMNIFINSAIEAENTKNKGVSTLDMFPTTLASLGVHIEGNRLGLGTNLFSNEPTIIKKYDLEYVTAEFNKNSRYYNKQFIYK